MRLHIQREPIRLEIKRSSSNEYEVFRDGERRGIIKKTKEGKWLSLDPIPYSPSRYYTLECSSFRTALLKLGRNIGIVKNRSRIDSNLFNNRRNVLTVKRYDIHHNSLFLIKEPNDVVLVVRRLYEIEDPEERSVIKERYFDLVSYETTTRAETSLEHMISFLSREEKQELMLLLDKEEELI